MQKAEYIDTVPARFLADKKYRFHVGPRSLQVTQFVSFDHRVCLHLPVSHRTIPSKQDPPKAASVAIPTIVPVLNPSPPQGYVFVKVNVFRVEPLSFYAPENIEAFFKVEAVAYQDMPLVVRISTTK